MEGVDSMGKTQEQTLQVDDIAKTALQREIDHLDWVAKVGTFARNENLTELNVETDPHKCGFGQWYYSVQRQQAETVALAIAAPLQQIEQPHLRLQQSAVELEKLLKQGKEGRREALQYFETETSVQLKLVQQHLAVLRAAVAEQAAAFRTAATQQGKRTSLWTAVGMIVGTTVVLVVGILLSVSHPPPEATQRRPLGVSRPDRLGLRPDRRREPVVG